MEEENKRLRDELEKVNKELVKYQLLSDAFEKRVIQVQMDNVSKGETIMKLLEKCGNQGSVEVKGEVDMVEDTETMRKLFIGGLDVSTTTKSLTDHFKQFGTIVDSIVMKDPVTGRNISEVMLDHKLFRSRGFGFVVFSDLSMVEAAQAARPHTIDGKIVDSKRATPREPPQQQQMPVINESRTKRIFVGGLKTSTDEAKVEEYFSKFGKVTAVDVVEDKATKKRKGFAYVAFSDSSAPERACQQRYHNVDDRRVEVKLALSRMELQRQSMHGANTQMFDNFNGGVGPGGNAHGFGNENRNLGIGANMGPGPFNDGPFSGNMGSHSYNNGPFPGNIGIGPFNDGLFAGNMGPGPFNDAPFVGNMGPGPFHDGPFPGNMGPRPCNDGPFHGNMGLRPFNDEPFPRNMGPGPFNDGPFPGRMGPGPRNVRANSSNRGSPGHMEGGGNMRGPENWSGIYGNGVPSGNVSQDGLSQRGSVPGAGFQNRLPIA